ncbi:Probable poly(glycerol-phosphate) alpha-glucosyltransferase [Serratia proteamaculans]|uniref:glycosyltransferase n=1 Tax=Serratia proteamaculans TaxID=28151 RepID=UPI0021798DE1|nr:glycosyltransferase [Serratia proteamaculans]CAI1666491.1 Probable poly(glycerol-phosphate) alpha-glucosyltransferase [Serratia proteamaculans]
MKVVMVVQCVHKIGGTEKATIELANLLQLNGHDVTIVSLYKETTGTISALNLVDGINISYVFPNIVFLKYNDRFYRLHDLLLKRTINFRIESLSPDVVFHTSIKNIDFKKVSYKKILMVHFSLDHYLTGKVTSNLLRRKHSFIDEIVFLSKRDADKYNLKFSTNNATYVPNSTAIKFTGNKNNNDNKRILFLGRVDEEQKQLSHAIEIIEFLKKSNKLNGWSLHIYGSGPDEKILADLIDSKNCGDVITMHGFSNNIDKVISSADIMILTSKYEGLPMCLIEAAAYGMPLISYDCAPGISDIVIDGYNGYIISQDDKESFIEKLSYLIDEGDLRAIMSENSREIAKSNFSHASITQRWTDILNNLVK